MYNKIYLSRQESKMALLLDLPSGDPYGGIAYGEFNDPVTAVIGAGASVVTGAYGARQGRKAAEAGADATERAAELQVEFERERLEEESRRWEMNRLEEQRRFETLTAQEEARYNELKRIEQERYSAMTTLEQQRYDERKSYYDSLTAEEKRRYEESRMEEQARYEAEMTRIEAMTEEEKSRYADQIARVGEMTEEEQRRYEAYSTEEKLRYARGVRFAEAATTEEQRRYDVLTAEEKSRWQQLTGEERRRYETQILGQEAKLAKAEEALQPFTTAAEVAQRQLQVELGLAPGEAGRAYMETPGYQAALEERTRQVEQEMATMGAAYSGRRLEEAAKAGSDVQSQYYQNYMSMLGAMASPQTATALAGMGIGQPEVRGQLPGMGQLYAGQPGAGGIPGAGAMTVGQPGAGQPVVGGSPYLGGPGGAPIYTTPGAGAPPTGTIVAGQLPGTGQLTMGQIPGVGQIPSVGGGLVPAAISAAQMRTAGAMAGPQFMQDIIGMGGNIYGGYLAGGGTPFWQKTPSAPTQYLT